MPVPKNVSTALAPKDEAWNAPALKDFTETAWTDLADAQKLKIMGHFAWAPTLTPADVTYTQLKLPHHDPATGDVNWKGLTAAAAVMMGARGGADIPQADVDAVKAHLAAHYKAFGQTAPWDKSAPAPVNTKNLAEVKSVTLTDAKMDTNGAGTFEGYASTFGNKDLQDDIVPAGAFKKTISDNNGLFRLLDQHDIKTEIGLVTATEDHRGLYVKGEFYIDPAGDPTNEIRAAREAYVKMKRRQAAGMPLQMSIGYRAINPTFKNGARILNEIALAEVSLVTFPANPEAVTTSVKDFNGVVQSFQQRVAEWEMEDAARDAIFPLFDALRECVFSALGTEDADPNATPGQRLDQLRVDLAQFSGAILNAVQNLQQATPAQLAEAQERLELEGKAGRVLSQASIDKIKKALAALQELIASTDTTGPGKSHPGEAAGEGEPPDPLVQALAEIKTDMQPQAPTLTVDDALRNMADAFRAEALGD